MIDILFVCYGGGHVAIIDALAEYIIEHGDNISFKILALTTAHAKVSKKYPENVVGLKDYKNLFSDKEIDRAIAYGESLLEENHRSDGSVEKNESLLYLGFSMMDLVDRLGQEEAVDKYQKEKRSAFLPTSIIERILNHESPKVLCTTTAPRFEKASLLSAKALDIKAFEIVDCLFGYKYKPTANHVIVMNEIAKQNLLLQGFTGKNYYTLGQPAIERTVEKVETISLDKLQKKMGFINLGDRANIVFFSQPMKFHAFVNDRKFRENLSQFLEKLNKHETVNLFIRIHPSEQSADYSFLKDKIKSLNFINDSLTLEETLALSDVVIASSSSVIMEGMACKKNVFTFHHGLEGQYNYKFYKEKPFIYANNFDELYLNLAFWLENRDAFEGQTNFFQDEVRKSILNLMMDRTEKI